MRLALLNCRGGETIARKSVRYEHHYYTRSNFMSRRIITLGSLALATMLMIGNHADAQQSNAPIREGLKRTGQAVGQGTRTAVDATGNAIRRTGQATRNVARGTANTARRAIGQEPVPYDAQVQAQANTELNTNLEQGTYADQGADQRSQAEISANQPHRAGYRGTVDNAMTFSSRPDNGGHAYPLRYDSQGREFICVNGSPVYFGTSNSADTQEQMAGRQNQPEPRDDQSGDYQVPPAPQPSNVQSGETYRANRPMDNGRMIESDNRASAETSNESNASTTSSDSNNTLPSNSNFSSDSETSLESGQSAK
jgi:hypothetical protein